MSTFRIVVGQVETRQRALPKAPYAKGHYADMRHEEKRLYGQPSQMIKVPVRHSCGHIQEREEIRREYWERRGLCSPCVRALCHTPLSEERLAVLAEMVVSDGDKLYARNEDGSIYQPPAAQVYPEFEALKRAWAEKKAARRKKRAPAKKAAPTQRTEQFSNVQRLGF